MKIKLLVALVLIFSSSIFAQSLVDRVPENAVLVASWRGTLDPGPGYNGSHTQAILNSGDYISNWKSLYDNLAGQLEKAIPNSKQNIESVKSILAILIHRPGTFYVSIPSQSTIPTFQMFVQAGDESASIVAQLKLLLDQTPNPSFFSVTDVSGLVTLSINPQAIEADFKSITQNPQYIKSLTHTQADSFVQVFINMDQVIASVKSMLEKDKQTAKYMPTILNVLKESGLENLHSLSFSGGFANQNWEEQLFIDAPSPRTGLLSLLEGKPFDAELLKRIPAASTQVTLTRFDFMKLLSEIKRLTTVASPEAGELLGRGIGIATLAIGKNIETDVLDPLGAEMSLYHAADVGADPLRQCVFINKLDNGFKAKQGLTSLWLFFVNTANTFMPPGLIEYKTETIKDNELTIFSWKFTGLAPSWTASNGYFYFGFDPKTVGSAARYKGAGIAENKTMQDLVAKLGQKDVISVAFFDTPTNAVESHRALADMFNQWHKIAPDLHLPQGETLLPSPEVLTAHSAPGAAVIWSDEQGIHGKTQMPYPLANMVNDAPFRKAFSDGVNQTIEPLMLKVQQFQQNQIQNRPPSGGL